ncbi:hypothetical protein [Acinetobacter sp. A47]|uniref:hypothetical protein n=1 Tax=Acinetobacter sp. A47 TaxID=1561217 RepID=UPI00056FC316|nr:hypothetical protein [Acinetobacter sp. A47]
MTDNYWKFILGLQHNAQQFFKGLISYHAVRHHWSIRNHDIFMVRDLDDCSLIYDSIDALIFDLFHQGAYDCSLYPFTLLFPEFKKTQTKFLFEINNYPVLVFNLRHTNIALIKIEREIVKDIQPIGDPREFWGTLSTQDERNYMLFSLIPLNLEQNEKMRTFNSDLNWENFYKETQEIIRSAPYQFYGMYDISFTNNLHLYPHEEEGCTFPLLENPSSQNNLAFTLLQQFDTLKINLRGFKHPRNELSEYQNFDLEEINKLNLYEASIGQQFVQLICHTANSYQSAYIPVKTQNELKKEIILSKKESGLQDSPVIENATSPEPETISGWRALTTLLIVLAILLILLYGLFLLVQKYEFAKFLLLITTILSVLIIIGRK